MRSSEIPQNADRLADRVRQHRQVHPAVLVIVVEGSPDKRLLERVLPAEGVAVFPAGPRSRAFQVAEDLLHVHDPAWLCSVDRDFDREVEDRVGRGLAVVAYDNADLEAMVWSSPALEEFLIEMGSETKLDGLGGVDQLRKLVGKALEPLVRLRAANAEYGWGLDFDSLDLRKKADRNELSLPRQSLCDNLAAGETTASREEIYEAAEVFPVPTCPATGEPLVHGKDAVAMTGVALRGLLGGLSHQAADPSELQKSLRLTARTVHLESTTWFRTLKTAIDGGI